MLRLENVSRRFERHFVALDSISLQVNQGEIVALVGTSGCGKSTLLRIIAGLDFPTSGQVFIDNERLTQPHSEVGIIFQEPRLMPWLTVRDNVQFGLDATDQNSRSKAIESGLSSSSASKVSRADKAHLVNVILERVGLSAFALALPRQLSGGMAQRVAIARALVTNPSILLLDEPFSALDTFLRSRLQDHLLKIWNYNRPTLLLVTHDIEEALVLSDRVIVMRGNPGRIHQEFIIDLPRPRRRTDQQFQHCKEILLNALDFSLDEDEGLPLANVVSSARAGL